MKPILLDLPMPIITQRLILRPPQIGDGILVNNAIVESFEKLHRIMPWAKTKPSVEESEEYVRQAAANWILKKDEEPYLSLFIFDKVSKDFIGGAGFHHINWDVPCLETGYWIRDKYSGKGFITEAVNALTKYAIIQLGVRRIEIRCDINNVQSKKIPEKLGYQLEATLKFNRVSIITDKISDTLVFVKHDLNGLPDSEAAWGKQDE